MSKKEKVIITLSVFCMVLTVLVGYTYSLWTVRKEQTGMNVVASNCLNIIFTEADDIELTNTYPMVDSEGLATTPYTFTIENTCDTYANYQINLETFDVAVGKTRMPDNYIKANLKLGNGTKISDVLNSDIEVEPTIEGATNAYKLGVGTLKGKATKTYNLRLWMDERITQDDENATNSSFKGKVSIKFTAALDPFAGAGTLKKARSSSPYTEFWAYKDNITEVEFQDKMETIVDATESWDVSATNDGSVMAYMINQGTEAEPEYKVYIQGKNGVKANPDSSYLFSGFNKLNEINGLEYFDTSSVTNMSRMFSYCSKLETLDLSAFDTSNVAHMTYIFYYCPKLEELNLSNFDTSNVINMREMFYYCRSLVGLDVSNFDTSSVTDIGGMFYGCSKLEELDVSNFDTSKVTNMFSMFDSCLNLTELDVSNFDTSNVINIYSMFSHCENLSVLDVSNFDTSNVTTASEMFESLGEKSSSIEVIFGENFNTSNVTDMRSMFKNLGHDSDIVILDVSGFDTSNVTNMNYMFADLAYNDENFTIDVSNFNTSNVTTMDYMFWNLGYSNPSFQLDISSFDTSNVASMSHMFTRTGYSNLNFELDVSNFDTSNVTNMDSMFDATGKNNPNFSLDLSGFDTKKVSNMDFMFATHKFLHLNLGLNFNTLNVKSMGGMFNHNDNLIIDGVDNINTSNVTTFDYKYNSQIYYGLFENCSNINLTFTVLTNNLDYIQKTFLNAATAPGAEIRVNYTDENEDLIDQLIATKSANSNVVKGSKVQNHNIVTDASIDANYSSIYRGKLITLSSNTPNKIIKSFKMNGDLIVGNEFIMPDSDAIITDVILIDGAIVESEHYPYPPNYNDIIFYEHTFEGATSITVELTYQTNGMSSGVYLYTSPSKKYNSSLYWSIVHKTEVITIPSDYIKVTFTTSSGVGSLYGFKAVITPNYD